MPDAKSDIAPAIPRPIVALKASLKASAASIAAISDAETIPSIFTAPISNCVPLSIAPIVGVNGLRLNSFPFNAMTPLR